MSATPTTSLSALGAGFSSEALGSQAVFRQALQALSHPGRCIAVPSDAQVPQGAHPASAALRAHAASCLLRSSGATFGPHARTCSSLAQRRTGAPFS